MNGSSLHVREPWEDGPPNDDDAPIADPDLPRRQREGLTANEWEDRWIEAPREWYSTAPPTRRWLFRDARVSNTPGVFPLGKAGQLVASGGVGKTMLLCSLARAVACGAKWLGSFACAEPGAVLLVLGEEDAEEAQRRLFNVARVDGPAPAASIVVVPLAGVTCAMLERDALGNPLETAFTSWLRSKLEARDDWRLIVIDPQSRFAGLDAEKDNALATRFVQLCESFVTPTRSVLVAHHTPQTTRGKGATEDVRGRGVTALHDGFRWTMSMSSEHVDVAADERPYLGEIVTLAVTKSNYARKPEPLSLRRDDHGALVPLDDIDREIIAAAKGGTNTRAAKSAEREQARTEREAADAARRVAAAAGRDAARRARDDDDDAAARAAITSTPSGTIRTWVADVKRARQCGSERAQDANARVRKESPST